MQVLFVQSKTLVAENQWMDNIFIVVIINGVGDDVDIMVLGHLLYCSGLTHIQKSLKWSSLIDCAFCCVVFYNPV